MAFELLERGVFSCLATMLLQMTFGDRYTRLDPREKTRVITTMDLSPKEKENLVTVIDKGRNIAKQTVNNHITSDIDMLRIWGYRVLFIF